jgi:hypothetical protein
MRKTLVTVLTALTALAAVVVPVSAQAATVPPPSGLWVASAGAHQVTWSWNAVPGATSYQVTYDNDRRIYTPHFRTVTGRWITLTGIESGQSRWVAVRAITPDGTTDHSVIVRGVAGAVPKPLGGPKPDADFCEWRWNPYVGAAKYLVQQSTGPAFSGTVESHVVTARTITLGVERDSYGYLRVKPLNAAGEKIAGSWSLTGKCYVPYHPV